MKVNKKNHLKNDRVLGMTISQNLPNHKRGTCLLPEEMAALIDGNLPAAERDQHLKHLAACKECYERFILGSALKQRSTKKTTIPYRPLALAASVLLVILSIFILYKSGLISTKSIQLLEKEEPEVSTTETPAVDILKKSEDSAGEYMKKETRAKSSLKRTREAEKRKTAARDETKGYSSVKKDNNEKQKPELPGTQRQLEVPYPQSPRSDKKPEKKNQQIPLDEEENMSAPGETEAPKNQMVQVEPGQTAGSIQELRSQEEPEKSKKLGLSKVVGFHDNGRKKLVNNYIQISGKNTLNEIVEYDINGRIISIQNPNTAVATKFGYFPNGNKKFREEYKSGKPHGNWIRWNQTGEIVSNRIYSEGKLKKVIK